VLVDELASEPTAVQFPALTQLNDTSDNAPALDASIMTGVLITGMMGFAPALEETRLVSATTTPKVAARTTPAD
jgi:hypothetical protein